MTKTSHNSQKHRVILMPSGRQGDITEGTTVLDAARSLGVEIESICGGKQTCGKCLISLERGSFAKHGITSADDHLTPPGEVEIKYAADHHIDLEKRRFSCAACVVGDVLITVPEESQARKQVVRKAAGELTIEVDPAVRLVYVEVEEARMGGAADWERVQAVLADEWELIDITIDPLLLRDLQKTLRDGKWAVTLTVWKNQEVIRIEPGYVESLYGLAVDVGSTTVAGHLCDLRTGEVVATESMMNPQVRYGEDLMSRVSYGMMEKQGVNRMHRAIIKALNDLAKNAANTAGINTREITDVVLAGNTVMHHLFLGIDPVELGAAPFPLAVHDALDLKARDLGLKNVHTGAMVHVLPCIAGHVGADNVGVLLAEQPHLDDKISLVIDVGTNAEILLGTKEQMYSASSPTGPAFEGAQIVHGQRAAPGAIERVRIDMDKGLVRFKVVDDECWSDEIDETDSPGATGICGSGVIEIVGELFIHGLIDKSGLFVDGAEAQHPAIRRAGRTAEIVLATADQTATDGEIVFTQNDIRQIQLGKAALYAGVRLLMAHMGVEHVDRVRMAGAFGSYIDPLYAMIIGLIPDCDLDHVEAIGNSAGDGARIALVNVEQREVARREARAVHYVETAMDPEFQDRFMGALALPHDEDEFPHLEGIIPAPAQAGAEVRASRQERRSRRRR